MITKGIIEGVNLENYSVKVRLPVFDKVPGDPNATSYDALPPATICVPKGQYPQFNIGDIVFVGFENNNRSNPIILGMLFKNNMGKELIKSVNQVLKVTDEAYLPKNTKVNDISINSIAYPIGSIYENVDPLFDVEGTFGGKWELLPQELEQVGFYQYIDLQGDVMYHTLSNLYPSNNSRSYMQNSTFVISVSACYNYNYNNGRIINNVQLDSEYEEVLGDITAYIRISSSNNFEASVDTDNEVKFFEMSLYAYKQSHKWRRIE